MIPLLFLLTLSPGETLVYEAKFAFISLGSMELSIEDTVMYNETSCYVLRSILASNPSLNWLFSLNDTITVHSRTEDLIPLVYEENIHESNYTSVSKVIFDHDGLQAWCEDTTSISIAPETRDMVSFWYYLRTIPLVVADTIRLDVYASMENHTIECPVVKKEVIETSLGEFNTILVAPQTEGKGVFGSSGSMDIWYSDDNDRYPVRIKARMKTGSILFTLKEVVH
jgi:hypothetical protein